MAEYDSVIPAGGSGTLKAKIKTTQTQSGRVSKSISVTTDSPQAQRLVLSVTFSAVTAVSVLPRPQINLNGTKGEVRPSILVFHRADGEKLEITGVENSNDLVVITTRPVTEETWLVTRRRNRAMSLWKPQWRLEPPPRQQTGY